MRGATRSFRRLVDLAVSKYKLDIPDPEIERSKRRVPKYGAELRWCDVCTTGIADCRTAAHCLICHDDDFLICKECVEADMRCLDEQHYIDKWERSRGCFNCRLEEEQTGGLVAS